MPAAVIIGIAEIMMGTVHSVTGLNPEIPGPVEFGCGIVSLELPLDPLHRTRVSRTPETVTGALCIGVFRL